MLIHITPRLYLPSFVERCELDSLCIVELGVSLSGHELAARRPYPNKQLWAGQTRIGRKALSGILFDAPESVRSFTAVARWAVTLYGDLYSERLETVATHRVEYHILDGEFDAVTDNMLLWYGDTGERREWSTRWAPGAIGKSPAQAQPIMEIFPDGRSGLGPWRVGPDRLTNRGLIAERIESFGMLTLERDRLKRHPFADRMPGLDTAIVVGRLVPAIA